MAKKMTTAPVFQPELCDRNPVRIEGSEEQVLNAAVHAARLTLFHAGYPEYDQLAIRIVTRLRLVLGDHGLIVRDYE